MLEMGCYVQWPKARQQRRVPQGRVREPKAAVPKAEPRPWNSQGSQEAPPPDPASRYILASGGFHHLYHLAAEGLLISAERVWWSNTFRERTNSGSVDRELQQWEPWTLTGQSTPYYNRTEPRVPWSLWAPT